MRLRSRALSRTATTSLLAIATAIVGACGSPARDVLTLPTAPTSTVPMGTDFTLAPGESVVVNDGALTLTFTKVQGDSRCPTQSLILCVWAGSAVVEMRATTGGSSRTVILETVATKDVATVDKYQVQLVGVTPPKLTTDSIPASAYRATLRMVRK